METHPWALSVGFHYSTALQGAKRTLSELWMGDFAGVAPAGWHFANSLARHIEFRRLSNSEFLVPIPLFAAVRAWARPQPTIC
jgi:hypothetical protein